MKELFSVVLLARFLCLWTSCSSMTSSKSGEVTTLPQYLTGILSVPVMVLAMRELLRRSQSVW